MGWRPRSTQTIVNRSAANPRDAKRLGQLAEGLWFRLEGRCWLRMWFGDRIWKLGGLWLVPRYAPAELALLKTSCMFQFGCPGLGIRLELAHPEPTWIFCTVFLQLFLQDQLLDARSRVIKCFFFWMQKFLILLLSPLLVFIPLISGCF